MDNQIRGIFVNWHYQALMKYPHLILVSILSVLIIATIFMATQCAELYTQSALNKNEALLLKMKISDDLEAVDEYKRKRNEVDNFEAINSVIKSIEKYGEMDPIVVLNVLEGALPDDVSVESIRFSAKSGEVDIRAIAKDRLSMTKILQDLESSNILNEISLIESETLQGGYSFELTMSLTADYARNHRDN